VPPLHLFAPSTTQLGTRLIQCLLALVLATLSLGASALGLVLQELPAGSLGQQAQVLVEAQGAPLSLKEALAKRAQFQLGTTVNLSFGIGAPPVWIRLEVNNSESVAREMHLVTGAPWTDRIDVHLVQDGRTLSSFQTGDEIPGARGLIPAVGYAVPLQFPPGKSELLLRVVCVDPMVVPLELLSTVQLQERKQSTAYQYGLHYGFLLALCAYNLLLFAGLGERSYLSYALYLGSYMGVNICYTGHGSAWLWPEFPEFQRNVIPVMMVAFGATGLLFARRFLRLRTTVPRIDQAIRALAVLGGVVVAGGVLAGSHFAAVWWGFFYLGLVCVVMVSLGILSMRQGTPSARYFLFACLSGMVGAACSTITTWGWVPFTELGYRAVEIGVTVEATLLALALALAYQMRHYQRSSLEAAELARIDPLTQVLNRRAFFEDTLPAWRTADRGGRPISAIMIDLDFFKLINDRHGHETGDRALVAVGRALTDGRRAGDVLARWGGEEFVLLLPETDLAHATALAESLRVAVESISLPVVGGHQALSASFGVAEREAHASIEALIAEADARLLAAKRAGRNRVCASPTH
jgi:diguanylate cyclase (GGDEF)-like protein